MATKSGSDSSTPPAKKRRSTGGSSDRKDKEDTKTSSSSSKTEVKSASKTEVKTSSKIEVKTTSKSETKTASKSSTENSTTKSSKAPPIVVSKATLYSKISKLEEKLASAENEAGDSRIFNETCHQLRDLFKQMLELKKKKAKPEAYSELRLKASVHFMTLKKLNRLDKFRTKAVREATGSSKQKVDALHLQLQNLLYEISHLQKEIVKCQQFKSKDEEIELISLEEFYDQAPEDISKKDETMADPHRQKLARLQYEHVQRQKMNAELKVLETERNIMDKRIGEKRKKLSDLKPQLEAILEKTKPVQTYLEMPISEEYDQRQMSKYLPHPLFILFSEVSAYGRACDDKLKVRIIGDIEDAKNFKASNVDEDEDDDDDDENDGDDGKGAQGGGTEDDDQRKKKRAPRDNKKDEKSSGEKSEKSGSEKSGDKNSNLSNSVQRIAKLMETHPLKVKVDISLSEKTGKSKITGLVLRFSYLHNLKILAVKTSLMAGKKEETESASAPQKEVLHSSILLSHLLLPEDTGDRSPNPATKYLLKSLGISKLSTDTLGSFYNWAQLLGGFDFPAAAKAPENDEIRQESVEPKIDVCFSTVEDIVKSIRNRLTSRLALAEQLTHLEKARSSHTEPKIPDSAAHLFPATTSSKISSWGPVDWEQYVALDVTQHLIKGGRVSHHDFFYRMQINREASASLIALIALKSDYPKRAPVFCLNLHWNGEYNVHNSERIRDLEALVNLGFNREEFGPHLLSLQIKRLLTSLDALLEAWSVIGDSADSEQKLKSDIQREKLFLHPVRGRDRAMPLRYDPNLKMYSQREAKGNDETSMEDDEA